MGPLISTEETQVLSVLCRTLCIVQYVLFRTFQQWRKYPVGAKKRVKLKNPITGPNRPIGFHRVEAPRFQDSRHMKEVRLSAAGTGRLYSPGNSWYSFLLEAESTSVS